MWCLVTIASMVGSAHYVQSVIKDVRTRPQYVMASSSDLYYLTPDVRVEGMPELYAAQTRLAMETIYNRGPKGLDNDRRRGKLFTPEANRQITDLIVLPELQAFRNLNLHQKVEIGEIDVVIEEGRGNSSSTAQAQLTRSGFSEDQTLNESWLVTVQFIWQSNPDPDDHAMYPTVCKSLSVLKLEKQITTL